LDLLKESNMVHFFLHQRDECTVLHFLDVLADDFLIKTDFPFEISYLRNLFLDGFQSKKPPVNGLRLRKNHGPGWQETQILPGQRR
jgi:hypothetical protein